MSLDTLLEAARYIELQELKQQHNRRTEISTCSTTATNSIVNSVTLKHIRPSSSDFAIKNVSCISPQVLPSVSVKQENISNHQIPTHRIIRNSFDIINPLIIDEASGEHKRKQPPLVFRSGTREVHNKLEKHRRAHLKECFDFLKKQLPESDDEKKTSNLSILHSAYRHIQSLKRRERELEHEMEKLARDKISAQQKIAALKKDISMQFENVDFSKLLPDVVPSPPETNQETVANERVAIPPLSRPQIQVSTVNGTNKEIQQQPVQTTALSVLPVGYPVSQGLVLQKVALVPKGLTDLSPLVSSPTVAHFITTPQQLNGKVVPLVNAQYVVKPVVVVSTASRSS